MKLRDTKLIQIQAHTNNPNFILFKWRLKRKHLPAKCVTRATENSPNANLP